MSEHAAAQPMAHGAHGTPDRARVVAPANWRSLSWAAPESLLRLQARSFLVGGIGLAIAAIAFFVKPQQFFQGYLVGWLYWLMIALGCLGILMLHHLSRGAWGLVIRRLLEAGARTLPWMGLLFLPILLFGMKQVFPWARPEAANEHLIAHKAAYLNVWTFGARYVLYFAIWTFFAWRLSKLSLAQDGTPGDDTLFRRMQVYSGPGLLIYGLTVTFASFDWLMSLDPLWASTIYGVYVIGCTGLGAFAFLIVAADYLSREAPMSMVFGRRHFHDYGKLTLAFIMLWAYFSFSQFLIIWSANLPEEIPFYLARSRHGWQWLSMALFVGQWAVPFFLLLSRDLKREPRRLAKVALWVLAMRFVDLYWQTAPMPDFHPESLLPRFADLAAWVGLGGLWLGFFLRELRSRPLLAVNAPQMEEALGDE